MAKKKEANQQQTSPPKFDPIKFLQEAKEELSKVVWPSRQQVISESIAVLLMVTLLASAVYLVDNLFGWAAQQIF